MYPSNCYRMLLERATSQRSMEFLINRLLTYSDRAAVKKANVLRKSNLSEVDGVFNQSAANLQ